MSDIKFEIIKHVTTLSTSAKGWTKELNIISWNGAAPKFDIRDWAPDHAKLGKGVTLTEYEAVVLANAILADPDDQPAPQPEEPKPQPVTQPVTQPQPEEPKPQPAPQPETYDGFLANLTPEERAAVLKARELMG